MLLLSWAVLLSALMLFHGAQSFVLLVPSSRHQWSPQQDHHPNNDPHSSVRRWKKKKYGALFVRNSGKPRRRYDPSFAINKKLVELGKKRQWKDLLEVAKEEQASFNNVNFGTAMNQLGRIRSVNKADPRLLAFLQVLATMIEERGLPWIQTRQASNIIHAIGKMQLRNPSTKRILKWISEPEIAADFVGAGNPHDIANVAWACATLGFESPNLFAEIEHRSKWFVEEGEPQAVANTALACAKLGYKAPNLFSEIDHQSKWLVEEGTPQAVANTAWACATLSFEAPQLFAEMESRSKWLVKEGNTQDAANTAWACATLGFEAPNMFAEIECQSKWLVEEGVPQAVANTAWACATLGFEAPLLFAEIERRCKWLVEKGKPQEVANTAWACATLGMEAPRMFAEIECRSKWLVEEGNPQNVANTAWAFATLGLEAPNLFAEIDSQSKWLVKEGTPQDIANTAWACATLGFEASELFIELDRHADRLIENAKPQDISNTCYAIAVLGKNKNFDSLLGKLWRRAIELFASDVDFIDEDLRQLSQTLFFAEADGIKLPQIPERMAKRMDLASNSTEEHIVSRSSKQVTELLNEIGFHHAGEVSPDSSISGNMLAIDFACPERMIAIEFDGPSHFLKAVGSGRLTCTKNGATKAKRRFLEQLGWTVINIDYRDYIQAQRDSNVQQWLRKILNASGVSLSNNDQIPKFEIEGTAGSQKGLNEPQQKKAMLLPAPAINNRILFKNVVKKDSDQFEAALVQELRERGITSVPMTKSYKPDFVKMKAAMKAWALEEDNDPMAKQDKKNRASFVPRCPALWASIFEELKL